MADITHHSLPVRPRPDGVRGIVSDWSSDQRVFKGVSWKKAMMWIFLLSDTFVFSCFLLAYMTARMSTTSPGRTRARSSRCTCSGRTSR